MPIGVVHRRLWRMFRTIENVLFWWWKNTRIRKFRLAYEKPKNMNENKFSVIECWSWEGWQSKRATHPALVERIRSPALSETCCFQSVIWEIDTTHWRHEPIVARALVVAVSRLKFFFFNFFCNWAVHRCTLEMYKVDRHEKSSTYSGNEACFSLASANRMWFFSSQTERIIWS